MRFNLGGLRFNCLLISIKWTHICSYTLRLQSYLETVEVLKAAAGLTPDGHKGLVTGGENGAGSKGNGLRLLFYVLRFLSEDSEAK